MILVAVPLMLIGAKAGKWHVVIAAYWATIFAIAWMLTMYQLGVIFR